MVDISSEWFYDAILLRYPSIVFQHPSWFEQVNPNNIPDGHDLIELKQWQIALMIQANELVNGKSSSSTNSIFHSC